MYTKVQLETILCRDDDSLDRKSRRKPRVFKNQFLANGNQFSNKNCSKNSWLPLSTFFLGGSRIKSDHFSAVITIWHIKSNEGSQSCVMRLMFSCNRGQCGVGSEWIRVPQWSNEASVRYCSQGSPGPQLTRDMSRPRNFKRRSNIVGCLTRLRVDCIVFFLCTIRNFIIYVVLQLETFFP